MQIAIILLKYGISFRDSKYTIKKFVTPANKHMQNRKRSFRFEIHLNYIDKNLIGSIIAK